MTSRKAKQRNYRRDRRKAKQSNWTREGKSNSKKVAHASSNPENDPDYEDKPLGKPKSKRSKKSWRAHVKGLRNGQPLLQSLKNLFRKADSEK